MLWRYLFGMMIFTGFISVSFGSQQCVYQSRTVTEHSTTISERAGITRAVVPTADGNKKCMVNFSVRINDEWHMATGEWEWSGSAPHQQACAKAVSIAESDVISRISQRDVSSEHVLVCNDDEKYTELKNITVGTVGSVNQFRPHPDRHGTFYHSGAKCRWFVDSSFTGNNIRQYEGVICETKPDKWVVVDKF